MARILLPYKYINYDMLSDSNRPNLLSLLRRTLALLYFCLVSLILF